MNDEEKLPEINELYMEAIRVVDHWRSKRKLAQATPNELHLYNIFTRAKNELEGHLACIEDTQGIYMKKFKK